MMVKGLDQASEKIELRSLDFEGVSSLRRVTQFLTAVPAPENHDVSHPPGSITT